MKKRSIGVSIFGWWYAIAGGFGILSFPMLLLMRVAANMFSHHDAFFMKQFTGNFYVLYAFIMSGATLAAGIGLLCLKSWARKLIIIISIIGMIYSFFFSINLLMHSSEFIDMSMSQGTLPKDVSGETIAAVKALTQGIMAVSMIVGMLFGIGFLIFVLWFFMRKSVREQFEPENKNQAQIQLK